MSDYYNDFDKGAAAWLRNLVAAGKLPQGEVDERSICDIKATDLVGRRRVHLFSGIGGWPLALELAGWPSDRPVWTGSCPCQPFSSAGKRAGTADQRHLWPEMLRLIRGCRPPVVFGEQVASAAVVGRAGGKARRVSPVEAEPVWLDGVFADLEAEGYTCGAHVLGAHSVGAPHIRQRLYWVANSAAARCPWGEDAGAGGGDEATDAGGRVEPERSVLPGGSLGMEHATGDRRQQGRAEPDGRGAAGGCGDGGLGDTCQPGLSSPQREALQREGRREQGGAVAEPGGALGGRVADPEQHGQQGSEPAGGEASSGGLRPSECSGPLGFWSDYTLIPCRDGKARRLEPGASPLVDGLPGRVQQLRGYGNAICVPLAVEFIKAVRETLGI